ncbi:MAG TPA: hypothetical protein PKE26_15315 [Kiritimatiellia bacterium]|nr:hypothetical protein [Kiritimatiellia bacterium]HMP00465.1 hypothetical protein [Kiritimatiellia bacterium]
MITRLQGILAEEALDGADDLARVEHFLDVILATHPQLLYDAQRKALLKYATSVSARADLPGVCISETALPASRFNIYGIIPPGLNTWERAFVDYLDRDTSGTILWWHRNPPRQDYSVCVLLEDGKGFYPDFVIGIKNRKTKDGILLADTKFGFERFQEFPKVLAEHPDYGRALIVHRGASGVWHAAAVDAMGRPKIGEEIRMVDLAGL